MLPIIVFLATVFSAGSSLAANALQGHWQLGSTADPSKTGKLIIDAQGRALFTVLIGKASTTSRRGFVSSLSPQKAEILLGNGNNVERVRCTIQSVNVMNCDSILPNGSTSQMFFLRRVAAPADAIKIEGRWKSPNDAAQISIDSQRQILFVVKGKGSNADVGIEGFAWIDGSRVELVFPGQMSQVVCAVQSSDLLRCQTFKDRKAGSAYFLTRIQ